MTGRNPYLIARFWSKVDVGRMDRVECWPWRGAVGDKGHGRFKIGGKLVSPHVFAYEYFYGPLPDSDAYHGWVVRHSCDNPPCCNPAHLLAGSQLENVRDMVRRGRGGGGPALLPIEIIAAIRESDKPLRAIAGELGLSIDQVKWYRSSRYQSRDDEVNPAHRPDHGATVS